MRHKARTSKALRAAVNSPVVSMAMRRVRGLHCGWRTWAFVAIVGTGALYCFMHLYDFLAIPTTRVTADVLVVEGWGGSDVLRASVEEYNKGGYEWVVAAAAQVERDPATPQQHARSAVRSAEWLASKGIPQEKLIIVAPLTNDWNKTAKTAKAACDKLSELGIKARGINVVTWGPHARRTRLAYQHAIGEGTEVGVVTVQYGRFSKRPWWTSRFGIYLVCKNLTGWLRECVLG